MAVIAVHGFLKKESSAAKGWCSKMTIKKIKQLVRTAQAQIVPRHKQLRLKLTSQQTTLSVDEYYRDRQN